MRTSKTVQNKISSVQKASEARLRTSTRSQAYNMNPVPLYVKGHFITINHGVLPHQPQQYQIPPTAWQDGRTRLCWCYTMFVIISLFPFFPFPSLPSFPFPPRPFYVLRFCKLSSSISVFSLFPMLFLLPFCSFRFCSFLVTSMLKAPHVPFKQRVSLSLPLGLRERPTNWTSYVTTQHRHLILTIIAVLSAVQLRSHE